MENLPDKPKDDGDATSRTAARVRDNQRRARQRHKAYVEDLQRRVHEYEQRGIQATLHMQQAARTVATENSRLRLLLRRHGVTDDEVDHFLQSFSDEHPPEGADRVNGVKNHPSGNHIHLPQGTDYLSSDKLAMLADASMQPDCCGGITQCTMTSDGLGAGSSAQEFAPSGINTLGGPYRAGSDDMTSAMTMSCTDAAKIVAQMQGHGDSDMAKAALGCGSQGECVVKNTALFQILEGTGDGV